MSKQPNYNRLPGMGDLPGDNTNPNSPDYVEPEFDESEAMYSVAESMGTDEVGEILGDLADAHGWLDWIRVNVELPAGARERLTMLLLHAEALEAKRDREFNVLNGRGNS